MQTKEDTMYILTHLVFEKIENEKSSKIKIEVAERGLYIDTTDDNIGNELAFISGYINCLIQYQIDSEIATKIKNIMDNKKFIKSLIGFTLMDEKGQKYEIPLNVVHEIKQFSDLITKLNFKN